MSGLYPGFPAPTLPINPNSVWAMDTENTQGQTPETVAMTPGLLSGMVGSGVPLVASRFYGLPAGATPGTLLTVTGTLYAYPFNVSGPATVKTLAIDTTTGQTGGAAFIGIYADNGAGYPGALVATSNNTSALIATSGAAVQTYTPATALSLAGGTYWLASIFTASATFPTVADVSATYTVLNSQMGSDTALHLAAASGQAVTGVSVAATYGTLSGINGGVFPASATLSVNAGTPLVILGT